MREPSEGSLLLVLFMLIAGALRRCSQGWYRDALKGGEVHYIRSISATADLTPVQNREVTLHKFSEVSQKTYQFRALAGLDGSLFPCPCVINIPVLSYLIGN